MLTANSKRKSLWRVCDDVLSAEIFGGKLQPRVAHLHFPVRVGVRCASTSTHRLVIYYANLSEVILKVRTIKRFFENQKRPCNHTKDNCIKARENNYFLFISDQGKSLDPKPSFYGTKFSQRKTVRNFVFISQKDDKMHENLNKVPFFSLSQIQNKQNCNRSNVNVYTTCDWRGRGDFVASAVSHQKQTEHCFYNYRDFYLIFFFKNTNSK